MKWKCLTCRGTFTGSDHHSERCPHCGSAETIDCNVEPVRLTVIGGELTLGLDEVPFRAGQVVRLGTPPPGEMPNFTAKMFSDYIRAMRNR